MVLKPSLMSKFGKSFQPSCIIYNYCLLFPNVSVFVLLKNSLFWIKWLKNIVFVVTHLTPIFKKPLKQKEKKQKTNMNLVIFSYLNPSFKKENIQQNTSSEIFKRTVVHSQVDLLMIEFQFLGKADQRNSDKFREVIGKHKNTTSF